MSEYIGARISLISKSNIRYVGTLIEINSENHTVALEAVRSFGTEDRRTDTGEQYPPSDNVYNHITFRGSDVKDLQIEGSSKAPKPAPPPLPDDPAIITPQRPQSGDLARPMQLPPGAPPGFTNQPGPFPPDYRPPFGPPFPNSRFGPGPQGPFPGAPGPPGFGMPPYGGPPGWYPGFHQPHPPFSPAPFGQPFSQPPEGSRAEPSAPPGLPPSNGDMQPAMAEADAAVKPAQATPAPDAAKQLPPPPPVETKPDVAAALAPPPVTQVPIEHQVPIEPKALTGSKVPTAPKMQTGPAVPTGPKNGRIIPAVPLPSPRQARAPAPPVLQASQTKAASQAPPAPPADAATHIQSSTKAATDAIAAAVAKLDVNKQPTADERGSMDNLIRKVDEMRAHDRNRTQAASGSAPGHRGGHRGHRGGRAYGKIEVPSTDFDFASANAKFNKQDLVKEAIASGSPISGTIASPPQDGAVSGHGEGAGVSDVVIPSGPAYNKGSSFFDNISGDRDVAGARRGHEFRTEERRKNMETFGQGSVDSFRGRGRGRGGRRGSGSRSRGAPRTRATA